MAYEKPPVVIDAGSYDIKAGFACDNHPVAIFRTAVGRPSYLNGTYGKEPYDVFVGDEAMEQEDLEISYPVVHGRIVHWDNMERVFHHILYRELKVAPEDRAIMQALPATTPMKDKYDKVDIGPVYEGGLIAYAQTSTRIPTLALHDYIRRLLEVIVELLTIWEAEQQPQEWNTGVICPVYKKGCKKRCTNYRGIALLTTAYKVLSYVLLKRLEPHAERILSDYQCGFRRNRSTIDQIFLLKQLMEKRWEYAQSVHVLFVDFKKAYDSIDRGALYTILRNFEIPKKIVDMIVVATKESTMRVRVNNELTDEFAVVTGLKQGDALSPMLFNLVLEFVLRKVLALDSGLQLVV